MKILSIIRPTVPKIALYILFFFASPAFFTVCNTSCKYSLNFFAGWMLMNGTAPELKFPMLLLLFATSYLVPSLMIAGFNHLKEKKMMLQS